MYDLGYINNLLAKSYNIDLTIYFLCAKLKLTTVLILSWFIDTVCLFQVLFCIMHSAFNLLVFPNSMLTQFS